MFNFCDFSPWYLSSTEYNRHPQPIRLLGVKRENRRLFALLDEVKQPDRRGEIFNEYMSVKFQLHEWSEYQRSARRSLRNNYLKFIRNWGVESSSPSGAVLKSWVESRFGIPPTFHRENLAGPGGHQHFQYRSDVIRGSSETSAILHQFDLVFEYCQYELNRRHGGHKWLTLFRGTHDPEEYEVIGHSGKSQCCVRLNNLSSFTADRERAWEFGSTVWKVEVPVYKIFFFSGLLPDNLLEGEAEYLVIGGEYWVQSLLF